MLFLIFGNNGWIGNMFINILEKNKIPFISSSVRANNKEDVENEIINIKPTHIFSFIGRTHGTYNGKNYTTIDYLEQKGKILDNVRDNLYSPLVLALLSKKYNIHFTYLGTGCIFDYDENHPMFSYNKFFETDKPNFFGSSYSIVKGFTDELMHLFDDSVLNLRIRMPITDKLEPRNFITKIINYEKICSIPNSMTVLDDLLPIALDLAINNKIGTINLTNPGVIEHNEILQMYKEIINPNFTWKNFTIDEQNLILDSKRSNNHLDTMLLENLYPNIKDIKTSVRDTLIRMKSNLQ
jgi:dTDP-4-dehydrorhamnose reductase